MNHNQQLTEHHRESHFGVTGRRCKCPDVKNNQIKTNREQPEKREEIQKNNYNSSSDMQKYGQRSLPFKNKNEQKCLLLLTAVLLLTINTFLIKCPSVTGIPFRYALLFASLHCLGSFVWSTSVLTGLVYIAIATLNIYNIFI